MELVIMSYILYLLRWQLSSPILAGVLWFFNRKKKVEKLQIKNVIIANLIGGLIFFPIDYLIFGRH